MSSSEICHGKAAQARNYQLVSLVEPILGLHRQLASVRTSHEQTALERQIAAAVAQIDHLVYQLNGLTDGETSILEDLT